MAGPLIINQGSPQWWLSPDIWVTPVGASSTAPPGVANPTAGQAYDVWVRVWNPYPSPVTDWNLFVCWAIPTAGPIPLPPTSQFLNGTPWGSPIGTVPTGGPGVNKICKATTTWTPAFENGGHECLIAVAYVQIIGFPFPTSLPGNAAPTGDCSIAQHNLGVIQVGSPMKWRFTYPFQVFNLADEERGFIIEARQAPLSEIEAFLPGVPGGRKVIDQPGKVQHLGVVASAKPDPGELEGAAAVHPIKIAPRGHRRFMLGGSLQAGSALIHVTQSLDQRVIGGLSVLVIASEK